MTYRVIYLQHARRVWVPGNLTLESAEATMRAYKRRGFTVWIVDSSGRFHPVKGARREPAWIE